MYSLSVIGGLGIDGAPGRSPGALDINESGEVVGRLNGTALQAFSTTGSSNLGNANTQAFALNDRNEVVGQFNRNGQRVGFRTTPNGQIEDGTTVADTGVVFGINNTGAIAGVTLDNKAFRQFENQPLQKFGTLRANNEGTSIAYDINSAGVTVGRADTNDGYHAFRYGVEGDVFGFGPRLFDLGTLGGKKSLARDINDSSLIVGTSDIDPNRAITHAFVTVSTLTPSSDLGTLATNDANANSTAFDINNRLQIVGESDTDFGEKHAFLVDTFGTMIDLNDLLTPAERNAFVLTSASTINEAGTIVGTAKLKFDRSLQYEEGRVVQGNSGQLFAFRMTPTATRLEAENLTLDTYRVETNSAASGNQLVSLRDAAGTAGNITTQLKQISGRYDIVVNYLDENDGNAKLNLKINGNSIDEWMLDKNLGSADPVEQTLTRRVISNVALRYGDTLAIAGTANGSEWARIDSIEFIPTAQQTLWEAEGFNLSTYRIENNGAARNGQLISLRDAGGSAGTATQTFAGRTGRYDVQIGYLDEADGVSQLDVKVNNQTIDSWLLDKNLGSPDPTEQTFVERTIKNVLLKDGDVFAIAGTQNGSEWARVDYVRLVAAAENATQA